MTGSPRKYKGVILLFSTLPSQMPHHVLGVDYGGFHLIPLSLLAPLFPRASPSPDRHVSHWDFLLHKESSNKHQRQEVLVSTQWHNKDISPCLRDNLTQNQIWPEYSDINYEANERVVVMVSCLLRLKRIRIIFFYKLNLVILISWFLMHCSTMCSQD